MPSKVPPALFALVFFFALPLGVYHAAAAGVDLVFRLKGVPYPSEIFSAMAGAGAACWAVAVSFFIYGIFYQKGRKPR